jgi:prepilin-type processing-associated H-X9-DG protein
VTGENINVFSAPTYAANNITQPYAIDWDLKGNYSIDGYTPSPSGATFDALDQAVEISTGVIFRATTGPGSNSYQPSFDFVSTGDGQGNTILLTENLNAGPWNGSAAYQTGYNQLGFGVPIQTSGDAPVAGLFGGAANGGILNTENGYIANGTKYADFWMINRFLNYGSTGSGIGPRPSSQHSGGVNAIFCDGRGIFLSENLDKQVYLKILTSNGGAYGEYTLDSRSFSN